MKARRGLLLIAALALAGCLGSVLPEPPERAVYALPEAQAMQTPVRWAVPLQLALADALPPRDGNDLLVLRPDGEFRVLAGVRWAAPLPALLEELLARQVERAGLAPVAARAGAALAAPLRLQSELRAFELHEEGAGLRAHGSLGLRLVCARDGRLLATEAVAAQSDAVAAQAAAATAALREVALTLARESVTWMARADVSTCLAEDRPRATDARDAGRD